MTTARIDPAIAHHAALDARMVQAARGIKVMTLASWPASHGAAFLADYARGVTRLPHFDYPQYDYREIRAELSRIAHQADAA